MKANGGPQSWLAMKETPKRKRLKNPPQKKKKKKKRRKEVELGLKKEGNEEEDERAVWIEEMVLGRVEGRENHEVISFLFSVLTGF